MPLLKLRATLVILLLPIIINAAGNDLSGSIADSDSGEPLPYVNVFFEGTDVGYKR
jgi:hypothetical protein